jgi:hypothetical protein
MLAYSRPSTPVINPNDEQDEADPDPWTRDPNNLRDRYLDAIARDAHQADNAPAPHQSPNEPEEGLNIMRDL